MVQIKRFSLGTYLKQYAEAQYREYLTDLCWKSGYAYPKCGCCHAPTIQRTVSMRQVLLSNFSNGGNGTSQNSYATDAMISGILFCVPG